MRRNSSDGRAAVAASHKSLVRQEQKLSHRVRNANKRTSAKAVERYLNSYAAKYKAALSVRGVNSSRAARQIASSMDLWKPSKKIVTVKAVHKGKPASYDDCHYRIYFSFGSVDKARQALIKNVLNAKITPRPEQSLLAGGRNLAVKRIRQYYRNGFSHVAKADVSSFYNSFGDAGNVSNSLGIPLQVVCSNMLGTLLDHRHLRVHRDTVKNILCIDAEYNAHYGGRHGDQSQANRPTNPLEVFQAFFGGDWEIARQGLMQGAKCSGYAAEILLSPVCQACSESGFGHVVNFADDFLLMAKSGDQLKRLYNILAMECRNHPAGPLRVTKTLYAHKETFSFLGYDFTPGRRGLLKPCWAEQHEKKTKAVRGKVWKVLYSDADLRTKRKVVANCERMHINCVRNFPAWVGGKAYVTGKLEPIRAFLGDLEAKSI